MTKHDEKQKEIRVEFWRRIVITVIEIAVIIFVVWMAILAAQKIGISEAHADDFYEVRYVICKDYVNARETPNKKMEPIGRFETGDIVYTDGQKKNGYLHCVYLDFECSEGWVFAGYLSEYKPETVWRNATVVSKGRLAMRNYIDGKRTGWLKPGATVKVYYWSDEWSLTNCGYVKTRYLELDGE